jgi:hypothetical protein
MQVGGELGMSTAFYAMFMAGLIAVLIICGATIGWQSINSAVTGRERQ